MSSSQNIENVNNNNNQSYFTRIDFIKDVHIAAEYVKKHLKRRCDIIEIKPSIKNMSVDNPKMRWSLPLVNVVTSLNRVYIATTQEEVPAATHCGCDRCSRFANNNKRYRSSSSSVVLSSNNTRRRSSRQAAQEEEGNYESNHDDEAHVMTDFELFEQFQQADNPLPDIHRYRWEEREITVATPPRKNPMVNMEMLKDGKFWSGFSLDSESPVMNINFHKKTHMWYFWVFFPLALVTYVLDCSKKWLNPSKYITKTKFFRYLGVHLTLCARTKEPTREGAWKDIKELDENMPLNEFNTIHRNLRGTPNNRSKDDVLGGQLDLHQIFELVNQHMRKYFIPSDRVHIDESMIPWNGSSSSSNPAGHTTYLQSKPHANGFLIRTLACTACKVIFSFLHSSCKEVMDTKLCPYDHIQGYAGKILTYLVKSSIMENSSNRFLIFGDAGYSSVLTARAALKCKCDYVGCVKQQKLYFPNEKLDQVDSEEHEPNNNHMTTLSTQVTNTENTIFASKCCKDTNKSYYMIHTINKDPEINNNNYISLLYLANNHAIDNNNQIHHSMNLDCDRHLYSYILRCLFGAFAFCISNAFEYYVFENKLMEKRSMTSHEFLKMIAHDLLTRDYFNPHGNAVDDDLNEQPQQTHILVSENKFKNRGHHRTTSNLCSECNKKSVCRVCVTCSDDPKIVQGSGKKIYICKEGKCISNHLRRKPRLDKR